MSNISLLGAGLVGSLYAATLHGHRRRDEIRTVYSRSLKRAASLAAKHRIPRPTNDLSDAICAPETDVVIVALPNHLHEQAVVAAAEAGKAVLCTKPLGRNRAEALRMLEAVEQANVFHGYLEDLVYTPKTLRALASVQQGDLGRILWVRSREAHSGPHSEWFWNKELAGGGAIVDLGCHCIEIARSFIGKEVRPMEVMCWGDTQVHPIETEDHAIGVVRYETGAIGQFEVSWTFRGGMDLRDEVSGAEGTIWLNHWLRTGYEMYMSGATSQYVAEKSEANQGWLFPVGDEVAALGYPNMFTDMLDSIDAGGKPTESFYDGYVVNAIIDAAYASLKSKQWEQIDLSDWRGQQSATRLAERQEYDEYYYLVKEERMPDGSIKRILQHKQSLEIIEQQQ